MTCREFRRRIDMDIGQAMDDVMRAHVHVCQSCRAALAVERALGSLSVTTPGQRVPEGFADEVLDRWALDVSPVISLPGTYGRLVQEISHDVRRTWEQTVVRFLYAGETLKGALRIVSQDVRLLMRFVYDTTVSSLKLALQAATS